MPRSLPETVQETAALVQPPRNVQLLRYEAEQDPCQFVACSDLTWNVIKIKTNYSHTKYINKVGFNYHVNLV